MCVILMHCIYSCIFREYIKLTELGHRLERLNCGEAKVQHNGKLNQLKARSDIEHYSMDCH